MTKQIEYSKTICGFEVTISVDEYDDMDISNIETPEGFDFDLSTLFMAKPGDHPLSGKQISLHTYLFNKAVDAFNDEYGSFNAYQAEVEA